MGPASSPATHVAPRAKRKNTAALALLAVVISVQAVQIAYQSWGKPGFGVDFELLYTVAATWGQGRDVYDDANLKAVWREHGVRSLPEPGRPTTPNVYPLTVAPPVWLLTRLSFSGALLIWMSLVLACEAWLYWQVLRAVTRPDGTPRIVPFVAAIGILALSYPMRLNLASMNFGLIVAALVVYGVSRPDRPIRAGMAMGLALIKYSVSGPLLLLFGWRRQYRLIATALTVQVVLTAIATWGGGYRSPADWLGGMRAEIAYTLSPGQVNSPDAAAGAAMHLEIASLWRRFAPWHEAGPPMTIALIIVVTTASLFRSRRGAPAGETPDLMPAAVLAATLMTFYHRAYDLVPVMVLIAIELVRSDARKPSRLQSTFEGRGAWGSAPCESLSSRANRNRGRLLQGMLWGALIWTVVPGLWAGWDSVNAGPVTQALVQPACAIASLAMACLLWSFEIRVGRGSETTSRLPVAA